MWNLDCQQQHSSIPVGAVKSNKHLQELADLCVRVDHGVFLQTQRHIKNPVGSVRCSVKGVDTIHSLNSSPPTLTGQAHF